MFRGIYERIRHPQTVAIILIWLGISLLLDSVLLLVVWVVFSVLLILITFEEEKDLVGRFKAEYLRYRYLVPAFWFKLNFRWNLQAELEKLVIELEENTVGEISSDIPQVIIFLLFFYTFI
jgi:hypothetical protein